MQRHVGRRDVGMMPGRNKDEEMREWRRREEQVSMRCAATGNRGRADGGDLRSRSR